MKKTLDFINELWRKIDLAVFFVGMLGFILLILILCYQVVFCGLTICI